MTRLLIFTLILIFFISCKAQSGINNVEKEKNLRPPLMGWASWNNYHVNINDSIIKSQTDVLIRHNLDAFGYKYINIDDGFFGGRDSNGRILTH